MIASGKATDALTRLEAVTVSPDTFGPAEPARLRSLAFTAAGDHAAAQTHQPTDRRTAARHARQWLRRHDLVDLVQSKRIAVPAAREERPGWRIRARRRLDWSGRFSRHLAIAGSGRTQGKGARTIVNAVSPGQRSA